MLSVKCVMGYAKIGGSILMGFSRMFCRDVLFVILLLHAKPAVRLACGLAVSKI